MDHVLKVSYLSKGLGLKALGRSIKQLVQIDFLLFDQHANHAI